MSCNVAENTLAETGAKWRTENLGYRLFIANDRFLRDKLLTAQSGGFAAITDALISLLINIDSAGTRVSEIALRTGLTKQSVVELIDRAENLGAVTRDIDLDDKRARIIRFTPHGVRISKRLQQGITEAEQRFVAITGEEFTREFKARFGAYSALPATEGDVVGSSTGMRTDASWRSGNVGRVLALASRRFAREALSRVHQRKYHEVTEVMLALFRNLDLEGTRLTEIAARARMTKQSMRELVDMAEIHGFVERCSDPTDRRAKIIAFSSSGLAMLEEMRLGLSGAEDQAGRIVGEAFINEAKLRLSDYAVSSRAITL